MPLALLLAEYLKYKTKKLIRAITLPFISVKIRSR